MTMLPDDDAPTPELSRRDFLAAAAGLAAVPSLLATTTAEAAPKPADATGRPAGKVAPSLVARGRRESGRPYNLLFVFTDQERYIRQWPQGLHLPGHDRLKRSGVTFTHHYCPAVMCTSSRAVMLTGLQTPDNRMFENADMPYVKALSPEVPTVGHMLRKAGFYTAYKGKWHLDAAFDNPAPDHLYTKAMDAYGFSDFTLPVDAQAHAHGGHHTDHLIAGSAISWLRDKGQPLQEKGQPWALFVSLVNPHDIMYFNTDAPGEQVQDTGRLLMGAARAPDHELYRATWNHPLPASLAQPMQGEGRPAAHGEFLRAWGYTLGNIPPEPARWRRLNDYYFNCLRAVDAQLASLLAELDALRLADDTIVMFTSDHGEMGGAHGLRGKGPFAYEETTHLPLHVVHPGLKGGQECHALTSHIDLVPSLLSLAGVPKARVAELAGRELPGKDFAPLLEQPARAGLHAIREGVLFTYSGLATNDSEVIRIVSEARAAGRDPKAAMKEAGYRPNLKKRGSLRSVCDGRYKFTRYFSPLQRNRPATLDELFATNDVELFDLHTDPAEMRNLAVDRQANADLLLAMNGKLEALIKAEIGVDDGREMPVFEGISWSIDRIDL